MARDLIRSAIGNIFIGLFDGVNTRKVVEWFDLGGSLPLSDSSSASDVIEHTKGVQGLRDLAEKAGVAAGAAAPAVASAIDFVLEGLTAQRKISRSEERGYSAGEQAASRRQQQRHDAPEPEAEDQVSGGRKKKYYN